jgi:hypothetical protein
MENYTGKNMLPQPPKVMFRGLSWEQPPQKLYPVEYMLGSSDLLFCRRPQIVLALKPSQERYEYSDLLKVILREACRVTWRASFNVLHVGRRITEYQLAVLRPSGLIAFIDIDEIASGESGESLASIARLSAVIEDRVREIIAQVNQPGIMVIYGSTPLVRRLQKIWSPKVSKRGHVLYSLPPPIEVSIVEDDSLFEAVARMYSLEPEDISDAYTINDAVVTAESTYMNILESIASDPSLARISRPPVDDEESKPDDAILHYSFKMLTVANLLEMGYAESEIEVEVMYGNIPVDILVGGRWSQTIMVEVETLYGTFNPTIRLSSVIRQRLAGGYNLWIVVPPLQAALYAEYIEPIMARYQSSVDFYTIDMSSQTLIPLQEFYTKLYGTLRKIEQSKGFET